MASSLPPTSGDKDVQVSWLGSAGMLTQRSPSREHQHRRQKECRHGQSRRSGNVPNLMTPTSSSRYDSRQWQLKDSLLRKTSIQRIKNRQRERRSPKRSPSSAKSVAESSERQENLKDSLRWFTLDEPAMERIRERTGAFVQREQVGQQQLYSSVYSSPFTSALDKKAIHRSDRRSIPVSQFSDWSPDIYLPLAHRGLVFGNTHSQRSALSIYNNPLSPTASECGYYQGCQWEPVRRSVAYKVPPRTLHSENNEDSPRSLSNTLSCLKNIV
jgi:hypothetical protein